MNAHRSHKCRSSESSTFRNATAARKNPTTVVSTSFGHRTRFLGRFRPTTATAVLPCARCLRTARNRIIFRTTRITIKAKIDGPATTRNTPARAGSCRGRETRNSRKSHRDRSPCLASSESRGSVRPAAARRKGRAGVSGVPAKFRNSTNKRTRPVPPAFEVVLFRTNPE